MMGEQEMARLLEIKGFANHVKVAKQGISDVRVAAAALNESATMFAAEAADVREQIEQARSDLRFEAESLGNSGSNQSGGTGEDAKKGEEKKPDPTQEKQGEGA
jgi:hypothetical protein